MEAIRTTIQNNQAISAAVQEVIVSSIAARPANTRKNYEAKQREWAKWCESRQFADGVIVSDGKLILFLQEVVEKRDNRTILNGKPVPLSKDGMEGYVKAIVDLYKIQCALGQNTANNAPRGKAPKELLSSRQRAATKRKRDEYVDRGVGTILDAYNTDDMAKIANHFMQTSRSGSASSSLRDRLDVLLAHAIMARGESMRYMQLADLFPLEIINEGPSRCVALVVVMQQGKMNQFGRVEYGACMRHRDVQLCPLGAMALYLVWRFHVSNEPFPNMNERRDWYDIYLLRGQEPTKQISYSAQAKAMKTAMISCGVLSSTVTHIRRSGATQMAEAYGASEAQIRRAGRWNTNKMEGCYLTSLPKKAMRALAQFHVKGGDFRVPKWSQVRNYSVKSSPTLIAS